MQINIEHALNIAESRKKIDTFLEELAKKPFPGGVSITNIQKQWHEGELIQMSFAFTANKGLFVSTRITGYITLKDNETILMVEIPNIVSTFVNESKIREVIEKEAKVLLV